jgi:hypothetical protein
VWKRDRPEKTDTPEVERSLEHSGRYFGSVIGPPPDLNVVVHLQANFKNVEEWPFGIAK